MSRKVADLLVTNRHMPRLALETTHGPGAASAQLGSGNTTLCNPAEQHFEKITVAKMYCGGTFVY